MSKCTAKIDEAGVPIIIDTPDPHWPSFECPDCGNIWCEHCGPDECKGPRKCEHCGDPTGDPREKVCGKRECRHAAASAKVARLRDMLAQAIAERDAILTEGEGDNR